MSKDDSQLQLKSLEQVLQLGHSIAEQDSQERLNEARLNSNRNGGGGSGGSAPNGAAAAAAGGNSAPSGRRTGKTPSPRRGRPPANSHSDEALGMDFDLAQEVPPFGHHSQQGQHSQGQQGGVAPTPARPTSQVPQFTSAAGNTGRGGGGLGGGGGPSNGAISRLAKVPGQTPNPTAKKTKKVSMTGFLLQIKSLKLFNICCCYCCRCLDTPCKIIRKPDTTQSRLSKAKLSIYKCFPPF